MEKTESQNRDDIIDICKRVYANGWVASNDGNVSIRTGPNTVLCTPTGMSKGYLTSGQLIKVDMQGNKLDGALEPSSEIKMHIDVYKHKEGVNSVVHAHPPYATGFAVAGVPLDECVMPEIIIGLGSIPLTKFGTPSTMEIPENIRPFLKQYSVFLLENHGALSVGNDVFQAYYRMESLELFAKISFVARSLGNVNVLDENTAKKVIKVREYFNLPTEDYPGCRVNDRFVTSAEGIELNAQTAVKGSIGTGGFAQGSSLFTSGPAAGSPGNIPGENISISKEKLVELVTIVVSSIIKNYKP
jgi:Ribulose-5-phosphate 4-epimerase and related epimerases and aldolases